MIISSFIVLAWECLSSLYFKQKSNWCYFWNINLTFLTFWKIQDQLLPLLCETSLRREESAVSFFPIITFLQVWHYPRSGHVQLWKGADGGCDRSKGMAFFSYVHNSPSFFLEVRIWYALNLYRYIDFWDCWQFFIVNFHC